MAGEQTSRLTMTAEALGFDASAKAVDTLAAAQARLAENQKALEGAKTGGSVEDVAKLTSEQQKLSFVVDELNTKNEVRNTTDKDWVRVLSTIDPVLGGYARQMASAVKGAGDLASANFTVKEAVGAATNAIKGNLGALGLLGAGAFALYGINKLIEAFAKMKEEAKNAEEAIKRQTAAIDELQKSRLETRDSLEGLSDRRKEGGFSFEESPRAQQAVERIGKRFRQLEPGDIEPAVAKLFGTGLDEDQLAQAAFLQSIDELDVNVKARPERRRSQFEASLRRNRVAADKFNTREVAEEKDLTIRQALLEAKGVERTTGALEAFAGTIDPSVFPGSKEELTKSLSVLGQLDRSRLDEEPLVKSRYDIPPEQTREENLLATARKSGLAGSTDEQILIAERILGQLVQLNTKLNGPPSVTNVHNNEKKFIQGRGAVRNGDNGARDVETR